MELSLSVIMKLIRGHNTNFVTHSRQMHTPAPNDATIIVKYYFVVISVTHRLLMLPTLSSVYRFSRADLSCSSPR